MAAVRFLDAHPANQGLSGDFHAARGKLTVHHRTMSCSAVSLITFNKRDRCLARTIFITGKLRHEVRERHERSRNNHGRRSRERREHDLIGLWPRSMRREARALKSLFLRLAPWPRMTRGTIRGHSMKSRKTELKTLDLPQK